MDLAGASSIKQRRVTHKAIHWLSVFSFRQQITAKIGMCSTALFINILTTRVSIHRRCSHQFEIGLARSMRIALPILTLKPILSQHVSTDPQLVQLYWT